MHKRELRVRLKDLSNPGKEQCIKFIKNRLAYTKEEKNKTYRTYQSEFKETKGSKDRKAGMLSETEYIKKQKEKRSKKDLSLIQTLSQSGAVSIETLN